MGAGTMDTPRPHPPHPSGLPWPLSAKCLGSGSAEAGACRERGARSISRQVLLSLGRFGDFPPQVGRPAVSQEEATVEEAGSHFPASFHLFRKPAPVSTLAGSAFVGSTAGHTLGPPGWPGLSGTCLTLT